MHARNHMLLTTRPRAARIVERACGIVVACSVLLTLATESPASEWEPAPTLNGPRLSSGAAADEYGNIWVLGGRNRTGGCSSGTGSMVDSVEKLSFDGSSYAAQWELLPNVMPTTRMYHSVVISRGFIYVLGGGEREALFPLAQVDRYDTISETWDSGTVPAMSQPRFEGAAIADSLGRIWSIGGRPDQANFSDMVTVFNPAQPELGWQQGPSLNHARARFGCVLDRKGRIYAIGGYAASGAHVQTVERLDPCGSNVWTVLPEQLPAPTTNDDQAVLGADGHIYVAGGWSGYFLDRVIRLDPEGGTWETWSPLGAPRDHLRLVLGGDDHIYAIGGEVPGCVSTTNVEKLYTGPRIFSDCNNNGIIDQRDIDCGTSPDLNGNGIPDECEPPPLPPPPAQVTAEDSGAGGSVNVSWQANAPEDNITGYRISFGQQSGSLDSEQLVGANVTGYQVSGLPNYVEYFFTVAAINDWGEGDPSGEVSATPTQPSGDYLKALKEVALAVKHLVNARNLGIDYTGCIELAVGEAQGGAQNFIAYQETQYGSGNQDIIKAWEAYNKGLDERSAGRLSKAVKRFRLSWAHAEQAE